MSDIDDILDKEDCAATYCGAPVHEPAKYDRARLELAALREEVGTARELLIDVFDLWDDNAIEHSTPDNYMRAREVFNRIRAALPPEKRAALAAKEEA